MSKFKSRVAFGSEAGINDAIEAGIIDNLDLIFLNEGRVCWISDEGKIIYGDESANRRVDDYMSAVNVAIQGLQAVSYIEITAEEIGSMFDD